MPHPGEDAETHSAVESLFLRDDRRHKARRPHLDQPAGNLVQPIRVFPLGIRVVQVNLAEINPISAIDLHVDQPRRKDIPAEVNRAGWWTTGAEKR